MIALVITASTRDSVASAKVAHNHLSSKPLEFDEGVCVRRFARLPPEAVGKFIMSLMSLGRTVVILRHQDTISVEIA